MKNLVTLLLTSLIFLAPAIAEARVVSNPSSSTPDAWCAFGGGSYSGGNVTGAEDCVDYNGNFLPTVTNAQTLGTSALVWSNAYLNAASVTGTFNVGLMVLTRTTVNIATILTQIPVTTSYEVLNITSQSANNFVMVATPMIATAGIASGTIITLINLQTPSVELTDAGTVAGSGLQLASTIRWLGQYKSLTLVFDGGDYFWHEVAYGNN